jgi:hypothetical protein
VNVCGFCGSSSTGTPGKNAESTSSTNATPGHKHPPLPTAQQTAGKQIIFADGIKKQEF